MKKPKKETLTMALAPDQMASLRAMSDAGRGSLASLIREGVDLLLAFYAGAGDIGGQALVDRRQQALEQLRGGR